MCEPPRWARQWLTWTLPRDDRGASIAGDLAEEHARRAEGTGRAGEDALKQANRWYAREALSVGARYAIERFRRFTLHGRGTRYGKGGRGARHRHVTAPMNGLIDDLRHAHRGLVRNPAYTLIAVGALALGIGVTAATFAVVDALSFRPLSVEEPERLVAVYGQRQDARLLRFSYPDWQDYREATRDVFEDVAGFVSAPASLATDDDAAMVWSEFVTPNWFEVVRPYVQLGRLMRPDDGNAVVLSHGSWLRHFNAGSDVLGRSIRVNGQPFTIVGVTGPRFSGTRLTAFAPDLWLPVTAIERVRQNAEDWLDRRTGGQLILTGRLAGDVSIDRATASMDAVATALGASYPSSHAGRTTRLVPNERPENAAGLGFTTEQIRFAGLSAMACVALVLLIACANVASLQLARTLTLRKDVAVRMSLGASRGRVVRQRIAESILVSIAAGVLGIGIALLVLVRLAGSIQQPGLEFKAAIDPAIESRVLVFTLAVSVAAGILAASLPALRESRANPALALHAASGGSRKSPRVFDALVVAQVAISFLVLFTAALFVRSLDVQRGLDPGFPRDNGLMIRLDPSLNRYSPEQALAFYDRLLDDLRALPGVQAVSRGTNIPLSGTINPRRRVAPEGTASEDRFVESDYLRVEPGWFDVLGAPLVEGRDFAAGDSMGAPLVAIVNQTLARRMFGNGPAVGRRIVIDPQLAAEIIGVASDVKIGSLTREPDPVLTLSLDQIPASRAFILVRTDAPPGTVAPAVRRTVTALDPALAIIGPKTLDEGTRIAFWAAETGVRGSATFGLLALLLAVAGLYGVVSYSIMRRVREIGIRMALGARAASVSAMVVRRGVSLVLIGLACGTLVSFALSDILGRLIYGVSPTDSLTFAAVGGVIIAVGAFASWIPARTAARVDPLQVLRAE